MVMRRECVVAAEQYSRIANTLAQPPLPCNQLGHLGAAQCKLVLVVSINSKVMVTLGFLSDLRQGRRVRTEKQAEFSDSSVFPGCIHF